MAKKKSSEEFKNEFEAWVENMFGSGSAAAADFKRNASAFFSGIAERFDLVSRKEFDAQRRALDQANKKLSEIEKKLGKGSKASKPSKASKASKKPAAKKAKPASR